VSKVYIRDMLYVNSIERRLGRKLTERELEDDDALELRFPDGRREFVIIPRLLFPDDVMSTEAVIDMGYSLRDDIARSSDEVKYQEWYNNERQENSISSRYSPKFTPK
jgi:hypothetical protein